MKRIPTVKAVEAVFSGHSQARRAEDSAEQQNVDRSLPAEIRTGPAARRALARDLVASLDQDMQYLGWFVAIVEAYPEDQHDWTTAQEVAAWCRFPLAVAEALLRIDHKSGSQVATGAKRQAMA